MKKFKAYASVFNVQDRQNDIILPGAYFEIKDNPKKLINLPILWQHISEKKIGKVLKIREDYRGLIIYGALDTNSTTGMDCYLKMKRGIAGVSIGYYPTEFHQEGNLKYISKIKLQEISIVTFPANEDARILALE